MTYKTYIPFSSSYPIPGNEKRGLAMSYYHPEDLNNVTWFYFWGPANSDPKCVPMSYDGLTVTGLSADYDGWLLVFNEPNNPPPYGANITPAVAVQRYIELRSQYPKAKMVVGNVSAFSWRWLEQFKVLCQCAPPDAWGIHGYVEGLLTVEQLIGLWTDAHNTLGGMFWITEWADTRGNVENVEILANWMDSQDWVDRWAYYTNRSLGTEEWWPYGWVVNLWTMDGTLTDIGRWWDR